MIVIGALLWLAILAVYGAVWVGFVLSLARLQNRRQLSTFEWDGSVSVFALRVVVIGLALFPALICVIYMPLTMEITGRQVEFKPRLIEGGRTAIAVAAATGLAIAFAATLMLTRPPRSRSWRSAMPPPPLEDL